LKIYKNPENKFGPQRVKEHLLTITFIRKIGFSISTKILTTEPVVYLLLQGCPQLNK